MSLYYLEEHFIMGSSCSTLAASLPSEKLLSYHSQCVPLLSTWVLYLLLPCLLRVLIKCY